jgi:cytochrome c biogenesis protein CcmG, thiol:disulfide interchange protein DsbE
MSAPAPPRGPDRGPDPGPRPAVPPGAAAGSRRAGIVVASVVVLLTLVLAGVLIGAQRPGGGLPSNPVGETAPDFALATLDGGQLTLSEVTDEGPVLLTFWASWCTTCKADMPALNRIARAWGPRGVAVVGVVIEDRFDEAVASAAEHELVYRSVFDADHDVATAYSVTGTPETYLIGSDGRVAAKWIGPIPQHDVEFQLSLATG